MRPFFVSESKMSIVFNGLPMAGTTAQRPTNAEIGQPYFDTTLKTWLVWNGTAWQSSDAVQASSDALTAVGTNQAGALLLTSNLNTISTSTATSAPWNGVRLPASSPSMQVTIVNNSANPIQVYGLGTDTINGVATGTGVTMPAKSVDIFTCTAAGAWYAEVGIGFAGSLPTDSFTDNITAVGNSQANGYQLTTEINRITAGAATTGVILPLAVAGLEITVVNKSANSIHVYGAGTDTIDDVATATGVVQMAGSTVVYYCTSSAAGGKWYANGIGTGFSGQYFTVLAQDGVTATGTNQAGAAATSGMLTRVSTTTNTTAPFNGVSLPASAPGMEVVILNTAAAPIQVYGAGTDTINGIVTTTGVSQGVGVVGTYTCTAAGNWVVQFAQSQQPSLLALSGATDAISPHTPHTYVVTKAGVDAMTLAAPTATTDDGVIITITSNTANAHTITATGLLQTGTTSVNVATFAAQKGAGLTLMAYQGKWNVISSVGITFS